MIFIISNTKEDSRVMRNTTTKEVVSSGLSGSEKRKVLLIFAISISEKKTNKKKHFYS